MLDEEEQREWISRLRPLLEAKGIDTVFVGSTAVVGLQLFQRETRDTDVLAEASLSTTEARRLLGEIADEEGFNLQERGWGSLVLTDPGGAEPGPELDLIVPGGVIPEPVARRIHEQATDTDLGSTAIPEHVLAMKAVAYGDCARDREARQADRYESDLRQFREAVAPDLDWSEVRELLSRFSDPRRRHAAEIIHEIFGRDVGLAEDRDPSVW